MSLANSIRLQQNKSVDPDDLRTKKHKKSTAQ